MVALLALLLVSAGWPGAMAKADEVTQAFHANYDPGEDASRPGDSLANYLGFPRSALAEAGQVDLELRVSPDGSAQVKATVQCEQGAVTFEASGSWRQYGDTPVMTGEFRSETAEGVPYRIILSYLPEYDETRVVFAFAEGTPNTATLFFGQHHGNLAAVQVQMSERDRQLAKIPPAYRLDDQALEFAQAPLIADNAVLLPLRQVLESLGADVYWNGREHSVTMSKGATTVKLWLDKTDALVNGEARSLPVAPRLVEHTTIVTLSPLAEWFGASLAVRRDESVSIISEERQAAISGQFNVQFTGYTDLMLKNNTNKPVDMTGWMLMSMQPFKGQEIFYFPEGFVLEAGRQVHVQACEAVQADGKSVLKWYTQSEIAALPADEQTAFSPRPHSVQLAVMSLEPYKEVMAVSSRTGDLILSSWQLTAPGERDSFSFPQGFVVAEGRSLQVVGQPGEVSANVLRWPNPPEVEAAYREEQEQKAAATAEAREQLRHSLSAISTALQLEQADWLFYGTQDNPALSQGQVPPFNGDRGYAHSFLFAKMRTIDKQLAVGDMMPGYWIRNDGSEAYLGSLKQDGTPVAWHLMRHVDDKGYITWTTEQVLSK